MKLHDNALTFVNEYASKATSIDDLLEPSNFIRKFNDNNYTNHIVDTDIAEIREYGWSNVQALVQKQNSRNSRVYIARKSRVSTKRKRKSQSRVSKKRKRKSQSRVSKKRNRKSKSRVSKKRNRKSKSRVSKKRRRNKRRSRK